jgi:hypothetical protein
MESYGELKDVKELLHHDCMTSYFFLLLTWVDLAKDETPKAQPAKVWGKPTQSAQTPQPVKSLLESIFLIYSLSVHTTNP